MKSLIVGITGCLGSYLAEYLIEKGYEVFGTKRDIDPVDNISHILDKIKIFDADLNEKEHYVELLGQCMPDQIYFLAAANQFNSIETIYRTNVEGTINFFESLIKSSCRARIIMTSSSAVYGLTNDVRMLNENDKLLPVNHYGLSKVFQEEIARYYYTNHSLDVIIVRPFNFTGPRENPLLVCTDFAKQIAEIENGKKEPVIRVGDLEAKRDLTDVRDTARGYVLLSEKGVKGEVYNLCSGTAYSIRMILEKLLSMSNSKIEVEVDKEKIRQADVTIQIGDNSKIFSLTGWKPLIPLDKTLEDILSYNRKMNSQ